LNQQQKAQQNQAALNLLQSHQASNVKTPSQVPSSFGDVGQGMNSQYANGSMVNSATLEQLQAQLKALSQQQQQLQQQKNQQLQQQQQQQQQQSNSSGGNGNAFTALLNQVAANQVAAAAVASNNNPSLNMATAALNAQQGNTMGNGGMQQPATAAMNASIQSNTNSNNLFDSAINLKSLLDEHKAQTEQQQLQQSAAAQALFNRLPPQSGLFHGSDSGVNNNMSTISLSNLLGSSNRLSSLLSLNSFLGSREASLADFTGSALNFRDQFGASSNALSAQLSAAAAMATATAQSQHDANKYRSNN
jgi:hypothetical protein